MKSEIINILKTKSKNKRLFIQIQKISLKILKKN